MTPTEEIKIFQKMGLVVVLIIGFVLMSGCIQDNYKYCAEKYPGDVYNPESNMCEKIVTPTPTPTPIITKPTTLEPTPTPIPTLNKNSVAYLNYRDDLREIEYYETELAVLQSNYGREMAAVGRDVSWARALTIEYNKQKAALEIRLNAAKTRAEADFAEAGGEI